MSWKEGTRWAVDWYGRSGVIEMDSLSNVPMIKFPLAIDVDAIAIVLHPTALTSSQLKGGGFFPECNDST